MAKKTSSPLDPSDNRRTALLDAAIRVFARYGYRKTSLDLVAHAAGWSRQGLYVHFASKEDLFSATVQHALTQHLQDAQTALEHRHRALSTRLIDACDEWAGRYVGVGEEDATDLIEASKKIAGDVIQGFNTQFENALALAIASSPAMERYASSRVGALSVAQTLHLAVQGLKDRSPSRQSFRAKLKLMVTVILAH
jgi:AcrR family transcriptional regulator